MRAPHLLPIVAMLLLAPLLSAQSHPTTYTIGEAVIGAPAGTTTTIYRNGTEALIDTFFPASADTPKAHHTLSFYDIAAGINHTWDPAITPPNCSAGTFSGDWGDPFETTKELTDAIAKGSLKPTGAETLKGIPTKIYTGLTQGTNVKVWFDDKDGLVMKMTYGPPGAAMNTMIDLAKVSFTPPPAAVLAMPAYCAAVKPPPTPAQLIAAATGDDPANWVNANYGPGSKTSCSILVHVVAAKTMAPLNRYYQAAIDTTYNQDDPHPAGYTFGVGRDGTSTYAGGGLHEITSQVKNFTLRIDNPPAYFNFGVNVPTPNTGANVGLIYRQCFAPVTNLYYILKDASNPGSGGDYLYAKSGKYAAPSR